MKKIFLNIKYFIFAVSCISICAHWLPPKYFAVFGLLSWGVPMVLIYHVIFLLRHAIKSKINYLAIIIIVIGFPHYYHTYSYSFDQVPQKNMIHLLSYNVRSFNCYDHLKDEGHYSSKKMIDFIKQDSFDILCLQEFYNLDSSSIFSVQKQMEAKGMRSVISSATVNKVGAEFGMAVFSKYPIINYQKIIFNPKSANRILKIDLKLPSKDTIRLFSCHLQSMSIRTQQLFDWELVQKQDFKYPKILTKRIYDAFKTRNKQVDTLLVEIKKSPYPVLVCGDFNDLPYSYIYHQVSKKLDNSFDEQGRGFGFSFNNPYLKFLRIDNQFFDSDKFDILSFRTCYEIPYSDHFPLYGTYVLKKENH